MKKFLFVAALTCLTLGVASQAHAQAQVDRGVAVVDLKYIFDNFDFFKAEKEKVDVDIKAAEALVAADKKQVEALKEDRDKCRKGTADYTAKDTQLLNASAALSVKVQQTRRQFLEREAALYFNAYKTISAQVESYAGHMGYSLVLRYNKDLLVEDDGIDARKVALQLNKPVVWIKPNSQTVHDPSNRDITMGVLEVLKQRYVPQGARQQPGVPRPTR